jgi:hypothetical protein
MVRAVVFGFTATTYGEYANLCVKDFDLKLDCVKNSGIYFTQMLPII